MNLNASPFDEFNFNIGEDIYHSVYDITIANMNRPHKHTHVEEGLDSYTQNWCLLEHDDGLRRGSSHLYLVDDSYYVSCSRTGLERAGNAVKFSKNCPNRLIFSVASAVFEGVLRRNSIDISNGVDIFDADGQISVCTPKQFVLVQECTEEEIDMYYDELADLLYRVVDRYQDATNVDDIEEIVEFYREESKLLYRDYTDFEPSILSQVIPDVNGRNGWIVGSNDIDGGKTLYVIRHEDSGFEKDAFCIEVVRDELVELVEQATETVLEKERYNTKEELKVILDEFMNYSFKDLKSREY